MIKEKIQREHLPRGLKKYIARQKAFIRRSSPNNLTVNERIKELYSRIPKYE